MDFSNLICYLILYSLDAASQGISKNIFPICFKLFLLPGLGGSLSVWLGVPPSVALSGSLGLRWAPAGLSREMASAYVAIIKTAIYLKLFLVV